MSSNAAGTMFIALMAATTVSLWTARVALAAAGRKLATAMVAAVEALTFVLVFQQIASNLDEIDRLVGYAVGVATGTFAGLYLNDRLSSGQSFIHVIAPGDRPLLGRALHELGWPATTQSGLGPRSAITTLVLVVDNARVAEALDDVRRHATDGFVAVYPLRHVDPVPLPPGLRQAGLSRRGPVAIPRPARRHRVGPQRRRCCDPASHLETLATGP